MKLTSRFIMTAAGTAVLTAGLCLLLDLPGALWSSDAAAPPQLKIQSAPLTRDVRAGNSFAPVVKRVGPSVVNIYSTKIVRTPERSPRGFDLPFFFFGDPDLFGPGAGPRGEPRTRREQSLGSGVIVTEDGYILTNNHVVDGADEIRVALSDNKTEYDAKLVGADPQTDVAVLKVNATKLPAVTLADSDLLEVGDVVLAVGNPFNIGQTVTMGIVSAKGRGGFGIVDYEDFIQTDASINPGNSGGALVDAEGRLVGINTWIISRTGGNQGVGFAIPANMARNVMERIVRDGKVTRGYLGVMIQPLDAELAKEFKLPDKQSGALVGEVNAGTPAEKAGLKHGDVITEFDGKAVTDSRHLRLMVAQTPPGTKSAVKVLRNGKEQSLQVTLGELPDAAERPGGMRRSNPGAAQPEALDGVEVSDIDGRARSQFGLPRALQGAVVVNVDPESASFEAGLRPGDVIVEINRRPVRNADEAIAASEGLRGRVLLRIWSNGASRYVVVDGSRRR